MKELFNSLSNVFNFFNEKRFVYEQPAPEASTLPEGPQAQKQAPTKDPEELAKQMIEKGEKLESNQVIRDAQKRNKEKYLLYRKWEVKAPTDVRIEEAEIKNVGEVPPTHLIFGFETLVFKINDKVYAERGKDGKFYETITKEEIVLKPGDNLKFPKDPKTYQAFLHESRDAAKAARDRARAEVDAEQARADAKLTAETRKQAERDAVLAARRGELENQYGPPSKEAKLTPVKEPVKEEIKTVKAKPFFAKRGLTVEFKEDEDYIVHKELSNKIKSNVIAISRGKEEIYAQREGGNFINPETKQIVEIKQDDIIYEPKNNDHGKLLANFFNQETGRILGYQAEVVARAEKKGKKKEAEGIMMAGGRMRRPPRVR